MLEIKPEQLHHKDEAQQAEQQCLQAEIKQLEQEQAQRQNKAADLQVEAETLRAKNEALLRQQQEAATTKADAEAECKRKAETEAEAAQQLHHEQCRQIIIHLGELSAWNPLHGLRLLGWALWMPQYLPAYKSVHREMSGMVYVWSVIYIFLPIIVMLGLAPDAIRGHLASALAGALSVAGPFAEAMVVMLAVVVAVAGDGARAGAGAVSLVVAGAGAGLLLAIRAEKYLPNIYLSRSILALLLVDYGFLAWELFLGGHQVLR